jgi:UDP-glucose 4-epimerase
MRILVTGAAGFLGRFLAARLDEAGTETVPFDAATGGDVRDAAAVDAAVAGCGHVIHLAGMLGTAELFAAAHEAVAVNVTGTLNVLQACERHGAGYTGITMPRVWFNAYQATKGCAMDLALAWNRHKGLPVSHVRAFNAYGAGQKLRPVQKIIPTFADRGWRGEPVPVWGDGTQQTDLVWAGDIAEMLARATGFGGAEVFDAGTGCGMSVNEVADRVIAWTGRRSQVAYLPMRPGEHPAKVVADGEGWDLLGWHPPVRPDELERAVGSYR